MSKKGLLARLLIIIVAVLLNVGIVNYKLSLRMQDVTVEITYESETPNSLELFYLTSQSDRELGYQQQSSQAGGYDEGMVGSPQTFTFSVPADVAYLRFDLGSGEESYENRISRLQISYEDSVLSVPAKQLQNIEDRKDVTDISVADETLIVTANGDDPYLSWDVSDWGIVELVRTAAGSGSLAVKIVLCVLIDVIALACAIKFKTLMGLPKEVWYNRKLILNLSRNDFKTKYSGSYLGIVWGFIQPIVTVVVYWFVFEKGLKAGASLTKSGISVPFVLWLIAGLVPWMFFSDALMGGSSSLVEYSYLVKKVVFKIDILPIVKVLSSMYVHVFFIAFTFILYACYHYYPDIYVLQIIYYSGATFVLALGLAYFLSALTVFARDILQVVNIILQLGVWVTPIMWNIDTIEIAPILVKILKLNPLYYIVLGYRQALIEERWFWENPGLTIYFWAFTLILFVIGFQVFRRLKVHFADVL